MKSKFISQAMENNHPEDKLEKIWKDWESFAQYAFNKSHSTCYAWIGYQTAYLKAHYPAEYMAAVLSNNMNDIKQVSFFMEECKRMGLKVLGPDVNESFYKFTVNESYAVRFGMGAIKGVGAPAVQTIVENRKKGNYKSIFDLAKRIDLRAANKKAFESLALAGGFDGFAETHRAQYFLDDGDGITFLEKANRYGAKYQENENSSQVSLFGESSDIQIPEPIVPPCEEWSTMEKLAKEKEVVGIYISGHPLDDYRFEMQYFCNSKLESLKTLDQFVNKNLTFGGIITNVQHRTSKNGKGWGSFTLEGYDESFEFRIFGEEYLKFRHFLIQNNFTFMKIMVREGWIGQDGKKGEPRIQFQAIQYLQDVLPQFAKKLIIAMDIKELQSELIHKLSDLFQSNKGDHTVTFEVLERETIKVAVKPVEIISEIDINQDETEFAEETEIEVQEDTKTIIVNKISMPSRKLKIKISSELLVELEKLQVNFKLN
jgi:DNA polymerase-3 subunit alpha